VQSSLAPELGLRRARSRGVRLLALAASALFLGPVQPADPVPVDAADGIFQAFASYPLVAVGEIHGWAREHAFLRSLIRDPRFSADVNDVVVEFGNARYQGLVDRYVLDGQTIPLKRLQQAWMMTTQRPTGAWEDPIYRRFYIALHNLNLTLLPQRRVRLVLGDPPIDWRRIKHWNCPPVRSDCFDFWMSRRDVDFAAVVEREVLDKGRRALVVAGDFHVLHRAPASDGDNVTTLIERRRPGAMFVAVPYDGWLERGASRGIDVEAWPNPSLAILSGTTLGSVDASALLSDNLAGATFEAVADACLYLGRH
jgi:hypothetical protein